MMIRLMALLSALAVMTAMGCGDDAQTEPVGVTPVEMAASERTVEAKRTALIVEEASTATPTVPLKQAQMPARESATADVATPLVSAQPTVMPTAEPMPEPTVEPTATPESQPTESGGQVDVVRIPKDVLVAAFDDALIGDGNTFAHYSTSWFKNISELPEDAEFAWSELPWGELTYVREVESGPWDQIVITYEGMFAVSVFGNGLVEDPIPVYGREFLEYFDDYGQMRASGEAIWSDENEKMRSLLNVAFNNNLAEMDVEDVDMVAHWGIPGVANVFSAPVSEREGVMTLRGDLEFADFIDGEFMAVYFSREGYEIWIVAFGDDGWSDSRRRNVYVGDVTKDEFLGYLGIAMDGALIRLLEEYP